MQIPYATGYTISNKVRLASTVQYGTVRNKENAVVMFYSVVHVVYIEFSMQYQQGISQHEPTYLPTNQTITLRPYKI